MDRVISFWRPCRSARKRPRGGNTEGANAPAQYPIKAKELESLERSKYGQGIITKGMHLWLNFGK
jgi:hypothetical protein